jgi:hypothetical protein
MLFDDLSAAAKGSQCCTPFGKVIHGISRTNSSSSVLGQCRVDLPKEDGSRRSEEGRSNRGEIRAIAIVGPCFRVVKTNIECHEELEIWGFCSMVGI